MPSCVVNTATNGIDVGVVQLDVELDGFDVALFQFGNGCFLSAPFGELHQRPVAADHVAVGRRGYVEEQQFIDNSFVGR